MFYGVGLNTEFSSFLRGITVALTVVFFLQYFSLQSKTISRRIVKPRMMMAIRFFWKTLSSSNVAKEAISVLKVPSEGLRSAT